MNKCLNCNNYTSNPKFCTLSCAATYNNKLFSKRKINLKICAYCSKSFKSYHDTTKCCSRQCGEQLKKENHYKDIENRGYFYTSEANPGSKAIRKYLIEKYGNKCSKCNLDAANWDGAPLVLIVDHIDGHANNWKIDNIRLICPNCDTQLPTFKGRNKGNSTRKYTITQK